VKPGDLLAGKYRIERLLGRGGMGAVYLAENTALGRRVAIKVVRTDKGEDGPDPELLARFRGEARAAAAIGHPGIIDVLDLGTTEDGTDFIVMEHLEGESLRDRLDRNIRLGLADVTQIGGELLDALAAAHDAGVVHRDLKPDNIFLVARPVPVTKILDFGISKLSRAEDASLTTTGRIMGTPHYMSPEQGRGARVGPPSDVYAAGAVLYRAMSGETPVSGTSLHEVISNLATEPPVPLAVRCPGLPRAFTDLVDRMLARLPEARPTARAAAAALRAAAEGRAVPGDALAETAPRAADSLAATAPRASATDHPGLESTLGATASEIGVEAPAPASPAPGGSRRTIVVAVGVLAVAVATAAFIVVRPGASRTASAPLDAATPAPDASEPPDASAAATPPVDAGAAAFDATTDAATDAAPRRPRRIDAGAGAGAAPNLDDIKDESPFKRGP